MLPGSPLPQQRQRSPRLPKYPGAGVWHSIHFFRSIQRILRIFCLPKALILSVQWAFLLSAAVFLPNGIHRAERLWSECLHQPDYGSLRCHTACPDKKAHIVMPGWVTQIHRFLFFLHTQSVLTPEWNDPGPPLLPSERSQPSPLDPANRMTCPKGPEKRHNPAKSL